MGWIRRIIRWYVGRLVCQHFCKFKQAGSDLKYTHVHILDSNPSGVTGLGHDDHTNNDDDGHVTISDAKGIRIQAEDDVSMALRNVGYLSTAYFHEGSASGECPEGFYRVKCRCRNAEGQMGDVWVCYTMHHQTFWGWYEQQKWDHRKGQYHYPYVNIAGTVPKTLACGKSMTLYRYAIQRVPNCNDYGGPDDEDNALMQKIQGELRAAAAQIRCEGDCERSTREIWRGWMCKQVGGGFFHASAAMQWEVRCVER